MKIIGAPKFIDTPHKKRLMFSFVIYYPILSLFAGAPLPFPSLFDVTTQQIAFLNFASLLITLVGSIIGVGFYLERRQNSKIDKIVKQMDDLLLAGRNDIKEMRAEMKEIESRISNTFISKNTAIEKNIEEKLKAARELVEDRVDAAKEMVDTRFRHIDEIHKTMQKAIDFIQQFQFGSSSKSIPAYIIGKIETQKHKDKPPEGMYKTPDSTETQQHKDDEEEGALNLETREKREKASKDRWDKESEGKQNKENEK